MNVFIWTDRVSYLAVAHADSVATARTLLLKTSDLGENSDGTCPERDRARKDILEQTPSIYREGVAEFSLSDSALVRELEAENQRLREALNEIWKQVAPGAYMGVDYSAQMARIKGICMVARAALKGGANAVR